MLMQISPSGGNSTASQDVLSVQPQLQNGHITEPGSPGIKISIPGMFTAFASSPGHTGLHGVMVSGQGEGREGGTSSQHTVRYMATRMTDSTGNGACTISGPSEPSSLHGKLAAEGNSEMPSSLEDWGSSVATQEMRQLSKGAPCSLCEPLHAVCLPACMCTLQPSDAQWHVCVKSPAENVHSLWSGALIGAAWWSAGACVDKGSQWAVHAEDLALLGLALLEWCLHCQWRLHDSHENDEQLEENGVCVGTLHSFKHHT